MDKIKIVRIIARLNIGGPAVHTILLSEGLDKNRFETVLVTGAIGAGEGDMSYLSEEKNIRPVIIPELGREISLYNDIIAFRKLFSLLRREKPDIVHTHTAKAGAIGRLCGLLYNVTCFLRFRPSRRARMAHTFHGHIFHSYFGRMNSLLFIWIERFLAVFTGRIIAVSADLKKDLLKFKIAPPDKIVVVPLGLELERYLKITKDTVPAREYKAVGIIGRLVPVKNHRMFLDAVREIHLSAGSNVRFFIVGDGELRRQLEHYAEKLGIRAKVVFTGWIKDLERIYGQLDAAALTSFNEGTPVALIEAQAAGLPCVAVNAGGVADVVEDGRSGFLVAPGDTGQFVQSMLKLLNNPQMARAMGEYGRARVKERFNKHRLIKEMQELYFNLVK